MGLTPEVAIDSIRLSRAIEFRCRDLVVNAADEVHHTGENNEQDTTAGAQSQHLGDETLVKRTEALLLQDRSQRREGPVVLGHLAGDLSGVLDPALHDVERGVEDCSDGAADGAGDQIVADLDRFLVRGVRRQHGADLEDAAEVAGVPQDVAPHGGFETLVEGEGAFGADDLADDVEGAGVVGGLRLVCCCSC